MVVFLAMVAGVGLALPVDREVVVDLVPPEDGAGEVEFVGCSKSCHDGVLTSEDQVVPERLIPEDRTVLLVDGAWPVTSLLSMREDLYYFALFGSETTERNKRRFSTRQHAGAGPTVRFEIGPTRLDEQGPMGARPDSFPHAGNRGETAGHPVATPVTETRRSPPRPLEARPIEAAATTSSPVTSLTLLVLSFLAALGIGGLVGWLMHRLLR